MGFVWFWTFWHWSRETFRGGFLLRSPLQGIGSHWDEWFRHEASESERRAIEDVGYSVPAQRRFIAWLLRHWSREIQPDNRAVGRFVLGQLAPHPPFNRWGAFEPYRSSYRLVGISALVLAEQSPGQPDDVRPVEAVLLPADGTGPGIVPEGLQTERTDLDQISGAAGSLLSGGGLLRFLVRWIAYGLRPYSPLMSLTLRTGWVLTACWIVWLWFGPEPGPRLFVRSVGLVSLWGGLLAVAVGMTGWHAFRAWRTGKELSTLLAQSQVRLRMNGGLTLKGASAGLPFCLSTLLALYFARPARVRSSWIWHQFLKTMRMQAPAWAATGVLTAHGKVRRVILEPKLRACFRHERIRQILAPRQPESRQPAVDLLTEESTDWRTKANPASTSALTKRFGFAAEEKSLRVHRCGHVAQAMMVLGRFGNRWQTAVNLFALAVSAVMVAALPDLGSILFPPPAPQAVPPSSPSPYSLWVSLDTKHPEYFNAVLESDYWSNRRTEIKQRDGGTPSLRAEIQLHRLTGLNGGNEENGTVWIERRRRFLTREFVPGERVARYSIPYLTRLGHE